MENQVLLSPPFQSSAESILQLARTKNVEYRESSYDVAQHYLFLAQRFWDGRPRQQGKTGFRCRVSNQTLVSLVVDDANSKLELRVLLCLKLAKAVAKENDLPQIAQVYRLQET